MAFSQARVVKVLDARWKFQKEILKTLSKRTSMTRNGNQLLFHTIGQFMVLLIKKWTYKM